MVTTKYINDANLNPEETDMLCAILNAKGELGPYIEATTLRYVAIDYAIKCVRDWRGLPKMSKPGAEIATSIIAKLEAL